MQALHAAALLRSSEANREANLQYSQCMRDQGIADFPDPGPDGGIQLDGNVLDLDSPQFQAADEACKQYMPGGGEGASTNESGGGG